jgi:hypothetical protein
MGSQSHISYAEQVKFATNCKEMGLGDEYLCVLKLDVIFPDHVSIKGSKDMAGKHVWQLLEEEESSCAGF